MGRAGGAGSTVTMAGSTVTMAGTTRPHSSHSTPQAGLNPGPAPILLPGQGRGHPRGHGAVGSQQQWPQPPGDTGKEATSKGHRAGGPQQQWAQPLGRSRERGQEHCSPPKTSRVLQQFWVTTGAEEGPAAKVGTDGVSKLLLAPRPRKQDNWSHQRCLQHLVGEHDHTGAQCYPGDRDFPPTQGPEGWVAAMAGK